MLLPDSEEIDLLKKKDFLINKLRKKIILMNKKLSSDIIILEDIEPINICYPFKEQPSDIKLLSIEKNNPIYPDILVGIKGSYLIFKNGVLNIKKLIGSEVILSIY